ncbi:MAG TPA: HAD-IIA family hydrolase [Solirubrobacteraceae bacterium]
MSLPAPVSRPERIFEGYVFDLDGTVYLGDRLLPGSARLLGALRELGQRVTFVSNNPTRTPAEYVEKLNGLGIEVGVDEVINTVVTTVDWVTSECPDARVFAIAEEPLRDALREAGVRLSEDPAEIDLVIASYDRSLDYGKLQVAFDALWRNERTRLVATNPDPYCPTPNGGEPDAGAVIAALEACTGRRCELHFGKPGAVMMKAVVARLQSAPEDCVVVGDRLSTDLAAARSAGAHGALVLTGETDAADLEGLSGDERPDYVLERLDQLLPSAEWERRGWDEAR